MAFYIQKNINGINYDAGNIDADTWQQAEEYCNQNNLILVGEFVKEISCSEKIIDHYKTQMN